MALGEVDYGLMGLVGGLTVLITFANSLMANAVGRFFAYSVGQSQVNGVEGLEICRRWFNIALFLHSIIAVVGLAVGYPIGAWAIRNFLTIPAGRVEDCIWIWRIVCAGGVLGMVSVPFNAMYGAKQYIAELTIYTFVTSTLNACFLYYMVTHPGLWLVKLSLWSFLLGLAPMLIIAFRAVKLFPECRFVPRYMIDAARTRELFVYASYRFFGALAIMIKGQGMAILVNKFLGPAKNAAMAIGGAVSGQCNNMSSALLSALSPAITNAYGAGQMERVKKLSYAACRVSAVMALVFVLPLLLEADEVFRLWLKTPPEGAVEICRYYMGVLVFENMTCGLYVPIFADGRIRGYQMSCLLTAPICILIAVAFLVYGFDVESIGCALLFGQLAVVVIRLYFTRIICGFDSGVWINRIAIPILLCSFVALLAALPVVHFMKSSLVRVVVTTSVVNAVFVPLVWRFVLDETERLILREKIVNRISWWRTPRLPRGNR